MGECKQRLSEALGRRLAHARMAADLSQPELARAAGLAQGMVSMVENGLRAPTTEVQLRWAKACGYTLAGLYVGLEEELEQADTGAPRRGKAGAR